MVYIDTSVIVAMFTNEPKTQSCIEWFSQLKHPPVSSDWLITEFHSAIALKKRTGQLQEKHIKQILQQFEMFIHGGIRLLPVSREAFMRAGELTLTQQNSRAGDALHLSVAIESAMKSFATLDSNQAETARQLKLPIETP